jgi:hypothetical protein
MVAVLTLTLTKTRITVGGPKTNLDKQKVVLLWATRHVLQAGPIENPFRKKKFLQKTGFPKTGSLEA